LSPSCKTAFAAKGVKRIQDLEQGILGKVLYVFLMVILMKYAFLELQDLQVG